MDVRYYAKLLGSVFGIRPLNEWRVRPAAAISMATVGLVLVVTAFRVPGAIGSDAGLDNRTPLDLMVMRATSAEDALRKVDRVYEAEIAPLERVLMTYRSDERLARRVATALVRESRRTNIKPDILLAVLLVENPWIEPSAKSPVGARGLMQVMPGHRGKWSKCPVSLDGIESNICYGAQIFRAYLNDTRGDARAALLRYNGCVRGTNTPNCHEYPSLVFARATQATQLARRNVHRQIAD